MAIVYGTTQGDFLGADQLNSTVYGGIFESPLIVTGNDRLRGGVANDKLSGGDVDDALFGSAGNNTLDRRTGCDKVYYVVTSTTQALNLVATATAFTGANGVATDGLGRTDTLLCIDNQIGGAGNLQDQRRAVARREQRSLTVGGTLSRPSCSYARDGHSTSLR